MKLMDYIRGLRKGKEAHRIEREAMNDPFLSDALEGFDSVKGDHVRRVEELQQRFEKVRTPRHHSLRRWSIAASLLIAVLGGSYLLWLKAPEAIPHKELSIIEEKSRQESASPTKQPVALKEKNDSTEATGKKTDSAATAPKPQRQDIAMQLKEKQMDTAQESKVVHEEIAAKISGITPIPQDSVSQMKLADVAAIHHPASTDPMIRIRGTSLRKNNESMAIAMKTSVTDGKIHGIVTSLESGEPLIGASVFVEGATHGTITDMDGHFTLDVQGKKVVVDYLGYQPIKFSADSAKSMLIAMAPDNTPLSEVVVVGSGRKGKIVVSDDSALSKAVVAGYNKESKPPVTGSFSTIKEKNSEPEPVDGWRSYRKYLKKNLRLPAESECKDTTGTVVVSFFIDLNGRPTGITVTQELCPDADKEAIRLINEGPAWKQNSGKASVEVSF